MSSTIGSTLSLDEGRGRRTSEPVADPQLVVALECSRPAGRAARYSLASVSRVALGRGSERSAARRETPEGLELAIKIPDRWMSSRHARLERSFGRWMIADDDSKNGTHVGGRPVDRAALQDGDLIELGHTLFVFRDSMRLGPDDPRDLDLERGGPDTSGLATLVPGFAREIAKLERVADSGIAVLITGESGTGKEVLARAAHELSGRRGEFVAVNCGAIPDNLVESELFGHKKGAFSGAASDRLGLVRSADGGTLFLDEIGDLPAPSQAALLRVLQEREVVPVGHSRPIPVDVRLISATHRDLDAMVAASAFRQDLFARVAGFRLRVPPLRERREDLGHLTGALLERIAPRTARSLDPDAARLVFGYDWPLNVRELENCLSAASVLAGDGEITPDHLAETVRSEAEPAAGLPAEVPLTAEDERLRDELVAALRGGGGNISAAARALGKDRKQIQRWVKRFRVDPASFR